MSDQFIVEHCSPTLAGLKTGNLFTVQNGEQENLQNELKKLKELEGMLTDKGLRLLTLRQGETSALIYLYRPDYLVKDLAEPAAAEILAGKGYDLGDADQMIRQLIRHLSEGESFPHEIGLFLGYPPSDVKGFMKNTRKGVKCVGTWKVYGNQSEAERTFRKYKKCTEVYRRVLAKGRPLAKMIVRTDNRSGRLANRGHDTQMHAYSAHD